MSKKQIKETSRQKILVKDVLGDPVSRDQVIREISKNPASRNQFNGFLPDDQERIISFLTGEKALQILSDEFFKKVLDPEVFPERLESLLSAIFGQEVEIIQVLPKEGIIITEGGSQVIMDIIVRLGDGSITTVEMQRLGYLFPGERSSCYVADMLMRQYEKVRGQKGKAFSYKDLKNVNLIIIMEKSSEEFKVVAPEYIHCKETSFSSGADVKTLDNIIYISLDTFKEKPDNGITTKLDSWLTFFTAEEPEDVIKLVSTHPDFLQMYRDISEFRKSPEEVIGMFSEALRIMDRNTTKYMIDEIKEENIRLKNENSGLNDAYSTQQATIEKLNETIADLNKTINELLKRIDGLAMTIDDLKKENEELKNS